MTPDGTETRMGGPRQAFTTTSWTTILRAQDPRSPDRREAIGSLVEAYWKPAYFFIRRSGHDVESAKDLTQEFFAAFLEKDYLRSVSEAKGRFRHFVLAALRHFLSNQRDRARAVKRGGRFNFVEAERDLPSADPGPEQAFANQWALEVFSRAMDRLRAETPADDLALLGGAKPGDVSDSRRKHRIRALRLRLRELLIEEILPTIEAGDDPEAEVLEILSLSSRIS